MSMKRFGAWGPQTAVTAHIKVVKTPSGEFEASAHGGKFTATDTSEGRAARKVIEAVEKEVRKGS